VTNREKVEAAYEASNAGDPDGFALFMDPDVEWHWGRAVPGARVLQGIEAAREGMREWREAWGEFLFEPQEILERGDAVWAAVRCVATGQGSGLPLELEVAHLWEFRAGRVVRMRIFGGVDRSREVFLAT